MDRLGKVITNTNVKCTADGIINDMNVERITRETVNNINKGSNANKPITISMRRLMRIIKWIV